MRGGKGERGEEVVDTRRLLRTRSGACIYRGDGTAWSAYQRSTIQIFGTEVRFDLTNIFLWVYTVWHME